MINISKNAQNYFLSLLSKEPKGTQIRVFILNPGMHNAECGVAYCAIDEVEKSDVCFKYTGFYVYINKFILDYLKDSVIDLIIDNLSSQLTFKAPYAKKNIFLQKNFKKSSLQIPEETSLQIRIKEFLDKEINPQLFLHGGQVNLTNISKEGLIFIKFSGGCNGCSMINFTLRDTVEKKILSSFPEVKKVIDETEHKYGNHSFY